MQYIPFFAKMTANSKFHKEINTPLPLLMLCSVFILKITYCTTLTSQVSLTQGYIWYYLVLGDIKNHQIRHIV